MFDRYLGRPEATAECFTEEGWFRTGDCVEKNDESGAYKILGRLSQDIIKKGGYKLSALEIENALLENSEVVEVAVVGVPCDKYGEEIAAFVVTELSEAELLDYCKEKMSGYKVPRIWRFVESLPRN